VLRGKVPWRAPRRTDGRSSRTDELVHGPTHSGDTHNILPFSISNKIMLIVKNSKKKSLLFSADKVTNLLSTLISLKIAERSEASHQKSKFEII
jgi:hypothetical protein